ncbi:MAG: DUF1588 domain-containing protein [Planctomycetota bacterium]
MKFKSSLVLMLVGCSCVFSAGTANAEEQTGAALLRQYCMDCHDESIAEGEFVLELDHLDWSRSSIRHEMERVHQFVSKGIMPPSDADVPTRAEKRTILAWLDGQLRDSSPIGGMTLRRLSSREYANSVRSVFGLSSFELPVGFPPDNVLDGFDNQSNTLVMAASHLEAFAETAAGIADQMFPPPTKPIQPRSYQVPAKDLVVSYSSAMLVDGAMRLASSGANIRRHATWPSKFEAPASGVYEVSVVARSLVPDGLDVPVPILRMESSGTSAKATSSFAETPVPSGETTTATFVLGIDRGGTVQFRYPNGPFDYDDKEGFQETMRTMLAADPRLALAWKQVGDPPRGGSGWDRLKLAMAGFEDDFVPLPDSERDQIADQIAKDSVSSGETLVYKYFEQGPYVAIESVTIRGPVSTYADKSQLRSRSERERFVGRSADWTDADHVRSFLLGFMKKLYRRPVIDAEVDAYCQLVQREAKASGAVDRGLHLAVRTALISPSFLYREVGSGTLDEFELASRLSFFLTSGPPDAQLTRLAEARELSSEETLREQVQRLLQSEDVRFVKDFANAWLGLDTVDRLMPDTQLIKRFTADHRNGMKNEVYETLKFAIGANRPVKDLIAPDFVFTNGVVGREIYEIDFDAFENKKDRKPSNKDVRRYPVPADGWRGGLLTMPAVMMATANGVDTQPVLRGVWVLGNILGSPPPEPPKAVPALTPDTAGASTPRELLARHMAESSCAACHRDIDPIGFVLESFDAVGRWRDKYPKAAKAKKAIAVETNGQLPDGTPLSDVTDLKKHLASQPEPVARCLAEKLMTYATGRKPNYAERQMLAEEVGTLKDDGYPIRDLVEAIVLSELFQVK